MSSQRSTITDPGSCDNLAIIGLGSNLASSQGTPVETVRSAIARIASWSTQQPVLQSSLWISEPVDCEPGTPPFVNAVIARYPDSGETPETLLDRLQDLEREYGRRAGAVRNAPRTLDLDLISFGTVQQTGPDLILPHPRAGLRRFVLLPLSEIGPQWRLPGLDGTVDELLSRLPENGPQIARIGD